MPSVDMQGGYAAATVWRLAAWVAVGGVLGSLARYAVTLALWDEWWGAPLGTLLVNVVGCCAIGALLALLDGRPGERRWRALLVTGVLGGFTTFSGFALDTVKLVDEGAWLAAGGYLALTLLAGAFAPPAGRLLVGILRGQR